MLIELVLLGGGAALLFKNRKRKSQLTPRKQISTLKPWHLVKDIKKAINSEGRAQLQLDISPEARQLAVDNRKKNNQHLVLAFGATGLAALATFHPVFYLLGTAGVFYLSKDWLYLSWQDLKRGHFFSLSVLGLIMTLGTVLVGQLLLAALGAVIGNFFSRIINNLESSSQQELVRVFGGHPEKVWLLRDDNTEIQIDFHEIKVGDMVIVNAGEVIPIDGQILSGEGQIDQHLLTGESQPVEKSAGDVVYAATMLLSGRLKIQVETTGDATVAAKIGNILNNTQSYKDTLMNRGREIADRFLPVTAGLSLLSLPLLGPRAAIAVLWSGLGGLMALYGPLSVLSYLQILSRHNILIKDGRVFESLRQVDTIVFDKTGTLTLEQPTVASIHPFNNFTAQQVLRYAAIAEYRQPHPIAKAILARAAAEQLELIEPDEASYEVGYGIKVLCAGEVIRVGSARYLQQSGIVIPDSIESIQQQAAQYSHSLIYVSVDDQLAGFLAMQPTIRPETEEMIKAMKQRGMKLYIISGDHEGATQNMAKTLGIDHYFANVLPEDKANLVQQLRDEGRFVCFVGDGINDAIALKTAQVSISLKGASSAATDTAQIIFMDGALNLLEPLFEFADEFEKTMQRSLMISIVPGIVIIGGVYLFHMGIGFAMSVFYLGTSVGLSNVLFPLVKYPDDNQLALEVDNTTKIGNQEKQ